MKLPRKIAAIALACTVASAFAAMAPVVAGGIDAPLVAADSANGPQVVPPTGNDCQISAPASAQWAAPYACDLSHHGIMEGDASGFRLADNISRAEFVTLLDRSIGLKQASGETAFTDVQGTWAAGWVEAAFEAGITTGVSTTEFDPNAPITREAAMTMLARAVAKDQTAAADLSVLDQYPDKADVDSWATNAMAFDLLHAVVQGSAHADGKVYLDPTADLTRGAAAKIVDLSVPEILPAGVAKISLISANDLHGHLYQDSKRRTNHDLGVALLTSAINGQRLKNPTNLFLFGGDAYQGQPISNLTDGESTQEWLNKVGVDAFAIGNHEFDWTVATLQKLIGESDYPVLSANIFEAGTDVRPSWAKPTAMLSVTASDGTVYKIGVIGITTPITKNIVLAKNVAGLDFRDVAPIVNTQAAKLRADGADFVIVVAHSGASPGPEDPFQITNEVSQWLAKTTQPIDAVIAGHTHEMAAGVAYESDGRAVPVVQAGHYGRALARIDLYVDEASGQVTKAVPQVWQPSPLIAHTPWADQMLAKWQKDVDKQTKKVVGQLKEPLPTDQYTAAGESALGDFVADGMLHYVAGAQVAIENGGGMRADVPSIVTTPDPDTGLYQVTWGDLYAMEPFGDTLVRIDMTGADIKTALEEGVNDYVLGHENDPNGHDPVQVAGITFSWDWSKPMGERVDPASLKLADGTPIDMNATYSVVTNNFVAGGGDGFSVFTKYYDGAAGKCKVDGCVDTGVNALDASVQEMQALAAAAPGGAIDYQMDGRISAENAPADLGK